MHTALTFMYFLHCPDPIVAMSGHVWQVGSKMPITDLTIDNRLHAELHTASKLALP